MTARDPLGVHRIFAQAFSARDMNELIALYEPDAIFAPEPGKQVRGQAAIRQALTGFLAVARDFTLEPHMVFEANGIALLCSDWTLSGTDPGGNPVKLAGRTSDVVRRQSDGSWLIVIDNPYGTA